jgi:hypothetical protein
MPRGSATNMSNADRPVKIGRVSRSGCHVKPQLIFNYLKSFWKSPRNNKTRIEMDRPEMKLCSKFQI